MPNPEEIKQIKPGGIWLNHSDYVEPGTELWWVGIPERILPSKCVLIGHNRKEPGRAFIDLAPESVPIRGLTRSRKNAFSFHKNAMQMRLNSVTSWIETVKNKELSDAV